MLGVVGDLAKWVQGFRRRSLRVKSCSDLWDRTTTRQMQMSAVRRAVVFDERLCRVDRG